MAAHGILSSAFTPAALGEQRTARLCNRPASRSVRGRQSRTQAIARDDERQTTAEPSAAALVALSASFAALPAVAASSATTAIQKVPSASPVLSPAPVSVPTDAVDSAVRQITEVVKAAGGTVKSGLGVAAKGAGYVKEAADVASPYVKRGVDIAAPVVKTTANVVQEVAKPVIKAAGPILQSGVNEVEQFLTRQGLNAGAIVDSTRGVTTKAEEAINYASPTVKSTAGQLSTASPTVLAEYVLGLLALYYLGPSVLKGVWGAFRGYAGQITAAAALDAVTNDNNAIIIDVRTASDKEYAGIPDIPNRGRLIELEYAVVGDRRVRGQLRNVGAIERQMTVLQIAALKRAKKGSRILLMDKNGGVAKDLAKALSSRGYKRVFVISGGFNSWTSSKLQTRGSSSVSAVEVLGPVFGTRGTTRGNSGGGGKATRFLPSGR